MAIAKLLLLLDFSRFYLLRGFFLEKPQEDDELGNVRPQNIGIPPRELAKLPPAARNIIESTLPEKVVCNYSYDIPLLPQLYQGNIVLIGDAAHAKSPTRARGMTAGFEDALALSRYLTSSPNIKTALAGFQA